MKRLRMREAMIDNAVRQSDSWPWVTDSKVCWRRYYVKLIRAEFARIVAEVRA